MYHFPLWTIWHPISSLWVCRGPVCPGSSLSCPGAETQEKPRSCPRTHSPALGELQLPPSLESLSLQRSLSWEALEKDRVSFIWKQHIPRVLHIESLRKHKILQLGNSGMCYTLHKYFSVRGNRPTSELNLEPGSKCLFIGSMQPSLVDMESGLLSTLMQFICILFKFIFSNFPAVF